jgi:hypothetical protein
LGVEPYWERLEIQIDHDKRPGLGGYFDGGNVLSVMLLEGVRLRLVERLQLLIGLCGGLTNRLRMGAFCTRRAARGRQANLSRRVHRRRGRLVGPEGSLRPDIESGWVWFRILGQDFRRFCLIHRLG